jgi:2-polyprenyl-3-methyl-5-hydroxy-6-metoxy-1,4-benzoquinol methylase
MPNPGSPNYLVRRILAAQLKYSICSGLRQDETSLILDIGCGDKPYKPLFDGFAQDYIGVDTREEPQVDIVAPADAIPVESEKYDCVICTQMLEHVPDPAAVVAEIYRVLAPGGMALVSTHGVIRYHPNPEDYWRWTHAGLQRLFEDNCQWSKLEVVPNGSTPVALAYLVNSEIVSLLAKARVASLWVPVNLVLNAVTWRLDRLWRRFFGHRPPSLAANYLVVARR